MVTGALTSCLIGGVQPIYGWQAPVILHNIKRWGAGGSQYEVYREPLPPPTNPIPDLTERRSQRRKAPPLHCTTTFFTAGLHCTAFFSDRRCPCAYLHHRTRWRPLAPPPRTPTVDLLTPLLLSPSDLVDVVLGHDS
jgi:hypothetical protein